MKYLLLLGISSFISLGCALAGLQPRADQSTANYPTETQIVESMKPTVIPLTPTTIGKSFDIKNLGKQAIDVTYCTMEGSAQKMDLYFPSKISKQPWPVTMYVHGGAWQKGDKNEGAGNRDIPVLQEAGFLVVSINYRLAPKYQFPAQIQDVKCAVRYLRAHSSEYNLDTDRIGVWGGSAGGHLVALLGLADNSAGWDVGEYLDQSSEVQAVVDMFGPSDLTTQYEKGVSNNSAAVFGAVDNTDPRLSAASPVTYVSPDAPPFLLLHGDQDELVPFEQSQILYDALINKVVSAEMVVVENAGHGFIPVEGKRISPGRQQISLIIRDFFTKTLSNSD